MRRGVCVVAASLWSASILSMAAQAATPRSPRAPQQSVTAAPSVNDRAVLDKYCVTCHNERTKTAGLMLDKVDLSNVPAAADVLERVVRKVRVGMMPPQGSP